MVIILLIGKVCMLKKINQQLQLIQKSRTESAAISPFEAQKREREKQFLNKLCGHALNLYERKSDIKKFTKLALSDTENTDYVERVEALDGISVLFSETELSKLEENEKLLKDLGLK